GSGLVHLLGAPRGGEREDEAEGDERKRASHRPPISTHPRRRSIARGAARYTRRAEKGALEMRTHRRIGPRGFTLVELSVVVVIVGVLATLAFVGYRRYRATARMAEATRMTTGIRVAQEAYKSERGLYANVSGQLENLYPATSP